MSRNFALLRRAGKEDLLSAPSGLSAPDSDSEINQLEGLPEATNGVIGEDLASQHESPLVDAGPRPTNGVVPAVGRAAVQDSVVQPRVEPPAFRRFESDTSYREAAPREVSPREASPRVSHLSSAGNQQVMKLVQRVFVIPNALAPRLVVFSSIETGNASSEICCSAGEVLAAHVSGSVCVVDGNLRAPSLHHLFGIDKSPGLVDAAVTPGPITDFAVRVGGGNLWVLPAGSFSTGMPGLFSSPEWHLRMEELKQVFDYVLIAAPAVSFDADAVLLGQRGDGVILVLEANSTRRETAREVKETLQSANVKLIGAILNNRTFPVPGLIYRNL
jgi:Mrp family chromosome partitioning ATPase